MLVDHFDTGHLHRHSSEQASRHCREFPNQEEVMDSGDVLTANVRKKEREKSIN